MLNIDKFEKLVVLAGDDRTPKEEARTAAIQVVRMIKQYNVVDLLRSGRKSSYNPHNYYSSPSSPNPQPKPKKPRKTNTTAKNRAERIGILFPNAYIYDAVYNKAFEAVSVIVSALKDFPSNIVSVRELVELALYQNYINGTLETIEFEKYLRDYLNVEVRAGVLKTHRGRSGGYSINI